MQKQEIPKTIPQEVKSDREEEIPQIEMPKGGRNFENFKSYWETRDELHH